MTAELERLDKLVETTPKNLDQAERAKRFEDLKRQRELASIAPGRVPDQARHGSRPAGGPGRHAERNPGRAARRCRAGRLGRHPTRGTECGRPRRRALGRGRPLPGRPGLDPDRGDRSERAVDQGRYGARRPGPGGAAKTARPLVVADLRPLVERLRTQRLEPLAKALGASADGQPPARRLIVLPSPAMAGIPIEALLAPDDTRTVSYAPSATVFKYLREQPRPDRHAGLLALGDPVYERPDKSSEPQPLPDHGLLVNVVLPGSNAASHGLKPGDVLLAYNGEVLHKKEDLKVVADGDKPIAVEVWRDGQSSRENWRPASSAS